MLQRKAHGFCYYVSVKHQNGKNYTLLTDCCLLQRNLRVNMHNVHANEISVMLQQLQKIVKKLNENILHIYSQQSAANACKNDKNKLSVVSIKQ